MAEKVPTVEDFYIFKMGAMWRYFKGEKLSFWMICGYLVAEFVRPQVIFPALDILPWAQLCLIVSLAGALADPSVKWKSLPANAWMVLFLVCILLSTLFATYPDISQDHIMDFFGWFIIYFLIVNIVNNRERFYIFLMIFIVAAGKIAVGTTKIWVMRGFSFTSWGLSGPNGFFQNSGELSVLMIMLFPLVYFIYGALKDRGKTWESWLLMLLWICPIMTTLGASSRGSQLALAVQLLMIFRKNIFRLKTLIPSVLILVLAFYLLPEEQKQRFSETGEDKSSQQRILYWTHGWEMMTDHPVLGVGYFNFVPYYQDNYSYDLLYEFAQLPHNIFVQVGTDVGFTGLFVFLMLINTFFITVIRVATLSRNNEEKAIAYGLGYGFLGFVIAGQFVTITYYPFMWIHLSLLMSLYSILNVKK
jgi:putative inorganic carbon (hco3(-)) transporter